MVTFIVVAHIGSSEDEPSRVLPARIRSGVEWGGGFVGGEGGVKGAGEDGGGKCDAWPSLAGAMLNSISSMRRFNHGDRAAATATENVTMGRAHTAMAIAMAAGDKNTAGVGKEGAEEGSDGFGGGDLCCDEDSGASGDGGFAGGIEGGGADGEDGDNTEGGPAGTVTFVSNWSPPVELEAAERSGTMPWT